MATRVIAGFDTPVSVFQQVGSDGNIVDTTVPAEVVGSIAARATDSGKPVKVGGVYNTSPTAATVGQRQDLWVGSGGQAIVGVIKVTDSDAWPNNLTAFMPDPGAVGTGNILITGTHGFNGTTWDRIRANTTGTIVIPPQGWTYAAASGGIVNTTTAVTIKAAAGAGVRNYLTSLTLATDALGGATEIVIRDGAAGTVIWRSRLQTAALVSTTITFATPLFSTANTLLEVAAITAVTGGIYVNAQGYAAP